MEKIDNIEIEELCLDTIFIGDSFWLCEEPIGHKGKHKAGGLSKHNKPFSIEWELQSSQ